MVVQRRRYVSEHRRAGKCCRYRATSEIALSGREKMLALTVSEARFEPLGETSGRLNDWKISEEQERPADLCIVLCADLAFSKVPLHANQLDTGEGIVYESNVLITKIAAIHVDRLWVR